ncbi:FHA domain-containing protein [Corallococcus sp. bb12-1]|uniref:FHA domain-containing protein n=1 Tax=Corallococcus sp. bb12-1 TaxID=2996784 RepID=UPI00226ECD3F|nr:FHA domain-containing protein [Corallococcus sp. bb12-1]MCY1041782.1 FHA domain-containing protein [Corallococcus sp. bb12-1]
MAAIQIQLGMQGGKPRLSNIFQKHEITIGRAPENDVILKQTNVSKVHCRAIYSNGVIMINDVGSTNGTRINGTFVTGWMPVRASDEVLVGNYVLSFSVVAQEEPKSSPREKSNNKESASQSEGEQKGRKERPKTPPQDKKGNKSEQGSAQAKNERRQTREQKSQNASSKPNVTDPSSKKSPWDVLGVAKGTSKAEARKAYLQMIALYHPDKVDALGPKLKELALIMTRELNDAWVAIESGRA